MHDPLPQTGRWLQMDALGINLSDVAMCMFALANLPLGSQIQVEFLPPRCKEVVRLGRIVRHRAGGIGQWIEVRGQNVNNPILLFIHGGPGVAFIPMGSTFQDLWEKYFTVVQWDQRGAGKTYESNDKELQRRTMNLAQMEQDTVEVANYLRTRFKREKIFVVGHSWGSMLGLWLAHEHPEMIYAFVGTGQAVSMQQNEEAGYLIVLQAARSRNNEQAIKELESVAPYPPVIPDMNKLETVRKPRLARRRPE
jgi:pimeloyl-ACP methyl ester carboxylesterase